MDCSAGRLLPYWVPETLRESRGPRSSGGSAGVFPLQPRCVPGLLGSGKYTVGVLGLPLTIARLAGLAADLQRVRSVGGRRGPAVPLN